MLFALLKISGVKDRDGYKYKSVIMERGASAKGTIDFDSEDKMITVVNRILAHQPKRGNVRRILDQIRDGGYYFFDLDLTAKEAKTLGFPYDASISTLHRLNSKLNDSPSSSN